MSNVYFCADLHLGHDAIRRHCNRPWPTIEEHDAALIANWNKVVTRKDLVYILGDFAMIKKMDDGIPPMKKYRKFIMALNSKKVIIFGNHDDMNMETKACFSRTYEGIHDMILDKQKITLSHYPMRSWNCSFHAAWHFHGHCHNRLSDVPHILSMDVGVDNPISNYAPIPWETLKPIMQKKTEIWREYWNKNNKERLV